MRLIIINGPSGVGKSTIAERISHALPLSLLLDIDAQRRFISGYRELRKESYDLVFNFCLAAVDAHLRAGHDVIIEKIIRNDDSKLTELERIGQQHGAQVYELILNARKETVLRRAHERGFQEGGSLTPEKAAQFWEEVQSLIPRRSNVHVIDTDQQTLEDTWNHATKIIGL